MPTLLHRRPGRPYLAGAPLLFAHRGGARLAPENTLFSFRRAVERWRADVLEMDVRATADGEVVVIHDPTVDRTCDGSGAVRELRWDELRRMDAGYRFRDLSGELSFRGQGIRIPLFEEVLESFPDVRLNVDVKAPEAAPELARVIRRHGAEHRVLVASEREANRRAVRGYPGPWGASRRKIFLFWLLHRLPGGRLYTPRVDALQVPETYRGHRVVTARFVREAHARNIPIHVWTVDDPDDMRRLLGLGVDGIQTDRPDVLARILVDEHGRPPPPGLETPEP